MTGFPRLRKAKPFWKWSNLGTSFSETGLDNPACTLNNENQSLAWKPSTDIARPKSYYHACTVWRLYISTSMAGLTRPSHCRLWNVLSSQVRSRERPNEPKSLHTAGPPTSGSVNPDNPRPSRGPGHWNASLTLLSVQLRFCW